jgi:protein tyrosine kinase modulator
MNVVPLQRRPDRSPAASTDRTPPEPPKELSEYFEIVKRRRAVIGGTIGILMALTVAIAYILPPSFRSTATILIEEQEIPQDLVRSAMTSYADQRIETIKQQVMSRTTLWKIVEQDRLYERMRRRNSTEDVIERFIKDINIDVISADVVDKRTQHPTKATIAFTLSYDGESPETAQKVANELTSLFLGENLRSRERHAQETTAFLKHEADNLSHHLEELEAKISTVKQRASGALPELVALNMQLMNQADRELADVDRDIRSLEERKTYLEGELATIKPHSPMVSATGQRILDADERLKALRAEYASSAASLSAEHPDIIKMKQEIEALERESDPAGLAAELSKQVDGARADLAALAQRYKKDHPDVVHAQKAVTALEQELRRASQQSGARSMVKPENPAYINIRSQLTSTIASLQSLKATRQQIQRRADGIAKRLEQTPQIEPEYLDLTRERDSVTQKYHEIRSRLVEAQVSEGLETQQKGERFSLIDPPGLPEKPEKPNRAVILLLGFILAVVGGSGAGAAAENLDGSIRTADQLARLAGALPLAIVPFMPNGHDLAQERLRRFRRRLAGAAALLVTVALIHWLVMPVDVLWFSTLRRLGLD